MKAVIDLARFFASHPLTHTSPIKAWQRWLSWQIKSRLRDEVIVPWIGGQLLAVRRGMTGATGNVYAGLHEFADMMFLLHFLRERDLFLDIGANVGTYTVLASGVCRAIELETITPTIEKILLQNGFGSIMTRSAAYLHSNQSAYPRPILSTSETSRLSETDLQQPIRFRFSTVRSNRD
jgi:hypothetical protein